MAPETESDWANVARVTNLAEAGFLADDLHAHQIETRIVQSERFSALTGNWSAVYLLQAPAAAARNAADLIARHMSDDQRLAPLDTSDDEDPDELALWRPVALLVLAGVASFALGQYLAVEKAADLSLPPTALSAAVDAIDRPFIAETPAGQTRYRLTFNHRQQAWYLDTDTDGDGLYEHRQRFHATGTK